MKKKCTLFCNVKVLVVWRIDGINIRVGGEKGSKRKQRSFQKKKKKKKKTEKKTERKGGGGKRER